MKSFLSFNIDFMGFCASMLCAVHCLLIPLAIVFLPMTGLAFLEDPIIETSLIGLSLVLASISLLSSVRVHNKYYPITLCLTGFSLLIAGQFLEHETIEIMASSIGGVCVATAHVMNWRLLTCTI